MSQPIVAEKAVVAEEATLGPAIDPAEEKEGADFAEEKERPQRWVPPRSINGDEGRCGTVEEDGRPPIDPAENKKVKPHCALEEEKERCGLDAAGLLASRKRDARPARRPVAKWSLDPAGEKERPRLVEGKAKDKEKETENGERKWRR